MTAWPLEATRLEPGIIYIGLPWRAEFEYAPDGTVVDVSAWTAKAKLRSGEGSGASDLASLTQASGITLDDVSPNVVLTLSDATTTALAPTESALLYLTLTHPADGDIAVAWGRIAIRYWGAP